LTRVVFDTNVLVSAMLSKKGASRGLLSLAASRKIEGVTLLAILCELGRITSRDCDFSKHKIERIIGDFLCFLEVIRPTERLKIVADDADNRVLECAVACKADYIASWDAHLTDLKSYRGIEIANPGKILDALTQGKN